MPRVVLPDGVAPHLSASAETTAVRDPTLMPRHIRARCWTGSGSPSRCGWPQPHPRGGTISPEAHRQRLRRVRSFFARIIEWDWPDASARNPVINGDIPRKPDPLPKFLESRRRRDCWRCSAPRTSAPSTASGVRSCRHRKLHPAAEPRGFRSVSQSNSPFGRRRCAVNLRPGLPGCNQSRARVDRPARLNRRLSRDSCCRPRLRPVAIGGSAGRHCSPGRPRWMR